MSGSSIPHRLRFDPRRLKTLKLLHHVSRHLSFSSFGAAIFREAVPKSSSKYQIYISRVFDPYVNLSIEHYLLQETPPDSTVLFLYVNSPCVVLGRNQNPWLETDWKLMQDTRVIGRESRDSHGKGYESVQLVRRRSGGGTVFHDYGNVNYSVICPTSDFSRKKHAQMVTQVLRRDNPSARVNTRHDIVLDRGSDHEDGQQDAPDRPRRRQQQDNNSPSSLKVSGSAYKQTGKRSLHHGTCLLASPNIHVISNYLRSPARPFIKARGVDSIRSPVGNVYDGVRHDVEDITSAFQRGAADAFADLYQLDKLRQSHRTDVNDRTSMEPGVQYIGAYVEEDVKEISEIKIGIEELKVGWLATICQFFRC